MYILVKLKFMSSVLFIASNNSIMSVISSKFRNIALANLLAFHFPQLDMRCFVFSDPSFLTACDIFAL